MGEKLDRAGRDVDYNKIIGANIRYERLLRNFTLEDLSYFLDISPSALGLIERGNRGTTIKNLCNIADFFSITVDELIKRDVLGICETVDRTSEEKKLAAVETLQKNLTDNELDFVTYFIKELVRFRKEEKDYDI